VAPNLDDEVLRKLALVSITARQAVESILAGAHRSVRRGLSIEFAGHREYVPGDDLRYLDWFVYARTDRFDIRQYEEETKLRATLVLDASGSMGYASAGAAKLDFARTLAAAIGFLLVRQTDAVGLAVCDTDIRAEVPPGGTMGTYLQLLEVLEQTRPGGETSLAAVLTKLSPRLTRRGLVILITDAFDDPEQLRLALHLLRHRKQEVRLLQILDPAEETFPFHGLSEFIGLEHEPRLRLDADRIRERYLAAFAAHQRQLAAACESVGIGQEICRVGEDLAGVLLRAFVGERSQSGGRR
jgi:uncharacterized protein (DUF58 family)